MPYKTKFREIEMPKTREELQALGTDANSMRSMGAAFYRSIASQVPSGAIPKVLEISMRKGYMDVVAPYAKSNGNVMSEKQATKYMSQGIRIAANRANDTSTSGWIDSWLMELGG